jgi:hypothetical protein
MENSSVLRGGLFVFECSRFAYLTIVLIAVRSGTPAAFPWLVYIVPNILFPLMLLFLWLDFSRYGAYEPLYKSGKCICVFSVIGWYAFSWRMNPAFFTDSGVLRLSRVMAVLLLIDLFTVAAAALISVKNKRAAKLTEAEAAGEVAANMEKTAGAEQEED